MLKNKKADVAITLLVLMTLVLSISALFIFNINSRSVGAEITNAKYLDSVYLRENEINFYVNEMIENSVELGTNKTKFIENFKKQLELYKKADGNYTIEELGQVEEQIDKIKIENNKVFFDLSIVIINNFDDVKISYSYTKTFEKSLV